MYQLAIFDLDGTLINSVEDLANAVNHGLQELHFPVHPVEAYYHFVGNGVPKLCERALPPDVKDQADALLKRFNPYYTMHCLDCTKPYPGIFSALERLRDAGIQLAVATNKTQDFAEKIVSHIFGEKQFDCIQGGNARRPKKPSPEILLEIMQQCGTAPEHTVMIGDSDVDILTARNAGIDAVGCIWGFRGEEELREAGAKILAASPADLTRFLIK